MSDRRGARAAAGVIVALGMLLALPMAGGAAASFQDGYAAYQQGGFATARRIWRDLAAAGDARAQFNLGTLYDEGRGVAPNPALAREWWRKAAAQDMPEALHNLAVDALFGAAGSGDAAAQEKALRDLARAAELGSRRSQYVLGKIYLHGRNVPADPVKGRYWIEKAANQGFDRAQYNMGKIARDGIAGPVDKKAAAMWFLKAAKQGYAKAQNHIGMRYARGEGVARDDAEALFWLTLAARQGFWTAEVNRKALLSRLSREMAVAAEHRADAWTPKQR